MAARKRPARRFELRYFIVCDDVRIEVGTKLTYLGVYGDTIIISTDAAALRLAFVFSFRVAGADPKSATFRLDGPDGLVVPELTLPFKPKLVEADMTRHAVIQIDGVRVRAGEYLAKLVVDNEELHGAFNVRSDAELVNRMSNPGTTAG